MSVFHRRIAASCHLRDGGYASHHRTMPDASLLNRPARRCGRSPDALGRRRAERESSIDLEDNKQPLTSDGQAALAAAQERARERNSPAKAGTCARRGARGGDGASPRSARRWRRGRERAAAGAARRARRARRRPAGGRRRPAGGLVDALTSCMLLLQAERPRDKRRARPSPPSRRRARRARSRRRRGGGADPAPRLAAMQASEEARCAARSSSAQATRAGSAPPTAAAPPTRMSSSSSAARSGRPRSSSGRPRWDERHEFSGRRRARRRGARALREGPRRHVVRRFARRRAAPSPLLRRGCNEELTLPLDGKRRRPRDRALVVDAPEPAELPPPPPPPPQGLPPPCSGSRPRSGTCGAPPSSRWASSTRRCGVRGGAVRLVDDADPDVRRTALHVIEERVDPATLAAHADAMLPRLARRRRPRRRARRPRPDRARRARRPHRRPRRALRDPHPHVRRAAVEALCLDPAASPPPDARSSDWTTPTPTSASPPPRRSRRATCTT